MSKQFTIIDGYNLLHVNGFLDSRKVGPGTLEKARDLLLGILSSKMDAESRRRTTVVFDSCEPNLPGAATVNEVLIEFANQHDSADELIAILIAKHSAPKQLTVVSSDHQVQRAAKARGSTAIDSDDWLENLNSPTLYESADATDNPARADKPVDKDMPDADYWKNEFDIEELGENLEQDLPQEKSNRVKPAKPKAPKNDTGNDIFPPGYADDLFDP